LKKAWNGKTPCWALLLVIAIGATSCKLEPDPDPHQSRNGTISLEIGWPSDLSTKVRDIGIEIDETEIPKTEIALDLDSGKASYEGQHPAGTHRLLISLEREEAESAQINDTIEVSASSIASRKYELNASDFDTAPAAPAGLAASEGLARLILSWTPNSGLGTAYSLERSSDGGNSWTVLSESIPYCESGYADIQAAEGNAYWYRLKARNGSAASEYSTEASASWARPAPGGAPTVGAVTAASVALSWSPAADNVTTQSSLHYKLVYSLSDDIGTPELAEQNGSLALDWSEGATGKQVTGLGADTLYWFTVLVRDAALNTAAYATVSQRTLEAPPSTQIIADHSSVARYSAIPQAYLDLAKAMWLDLPGESHARGIRNGARLLAAQDSRYAVSVVESGTPETAISAHLRLSCATWGDYSSATGWRYDYGEEDWYTNSTGRERTKAHLAYCNENGFSISAFGFGWCWDMTWAGWLTPRPTSPNEVDPVYNVHWAGSTHNGPEDNRIWGLDSGDQALTGNSVCMDTYLAATQSYADYCAEQGYVTKVFFTTGPVDSYAGESAAQREIKHDYIRAYVKADASRILFDYADIIAWDDAGTENIQYWNGLPYQNIASTNTLPLEGASSDQHPSGDDHIGDRGALRLAKAMWWMLARMAGWDGND